MLQRSVEAFLTHPEISEVVVALPSPMASAPPAWLKGVRVVAGGESRQSSVANAFDEVPVTSEVVLDVIAATIPRDEVFLAQTPQAFRREILEEAVALGRLGVDASDEAALVERAGHAVRVVTGDASNVKITTAADLDAARERLGRAPAAVTRVGVGYDLHRLVEGRPLILAGVIIASDRGPVAHSDGDAICHAVTDAILGAARAGDIGQLYPDTDARWKDASSIALLRDAVAIVSERGWTVENVDVVVILERPKLATHRQAMETSLASALGVDANCVSIKAKTNEGVDAVGRGEAIATHAVALLKRL
jgi:2-C-methyl-D-erythritol 4-phosphate cytidylyltransferase/2-C-methyl-D-erythritol 2,4-cyclodiphosphate synthase